MGLPTGRRGDLGALVDDLAAEHDVLDELLRSVPERAWSLPTPAEGWTVKHQIVHLTVFDAIAGDCLAGRTDRIAELLTLAAQRSEREVSDAVLADGLARPVAAVLADWRAQRAALLRGLRALDPTARVVWAAGPMSARSFVTARLMETWAHGLDCHAALGAVPADTPRLRHVGRLTYQALPYAFARAGRVMPGELELLRVEVDGPDGARWRFGPEGATEVIRGAAGEWARIGVQRLRADAAVTIRADGPLAAAALEVARAYA